MMRSKKRRYQPHLENLDRRDLPAVFPGVTATLADGVLNVSGTNPNAVIQINLTGRMVHGTVRGAVVVKGVGRFQAAQVDSIEIEKAAASERVVIRHQGRWSPPTTITVATSTGTPDNTVAAGTPITHPAVVTPPSQPVVQVPTPSPGTPATAGVILGATEQAIVDLTNQDRAQNGLPPLTVNAQLVSMAQIEAGNMVQFGVMSHTIPQAAQPDLLSRANYIGYRYSWLSENIAYNYFDANSVVSGWMGSTGHRANILDPKVSEIGVAVKAASDGSLYFCQVFGAPATW
jgi:uncharacterized protein YkwD